MSKKLGKKKMRESGIVPEPNPTPPSPALLSSPQPSQSSLTVRGVLLVFITGGATALYVTLANWSYGAALADDMVTESATLFFAWLAGCCALALSEVLGAFTPKRRLQLNLTFALGLAIVTVSLGVYFNTKRPMQQISTPLLVAQIQTLQEIDSFVGKKEEFELRETFDLNKMLYFNDRMVVRDLRPDIINKNESEQIDAYFNGGRTIMYQKWINWHVAPTGNLNLDAIPGNIGLLHTSQKYQDNYNRLWMYEKSAALPDNVRKQLGALRMAVTDDTMLILDTLNDCFHSDAGIVIYSEDSTSSYYGSLNNAYAFRIKPLAPYAANVNKAIKEYLKTQ